MSSRAPLLLFASLALTAAAIWVGWVELGPLRSGGRTGAQAYLALTAAPPEAGYSLQTRQLALIGCIDALNSLQHRTQSRVVTAGVTDNCEEMAEATLKQNPANSLAWLLAALVAADRNNMETMVAALAHSQRTGPTEQWIASQRVELAERLRERAGPDTLSFMDEDLALMVRSSSGVGAIARRYVSQPEFRDRITDVVEGLSEIDQARFVGWVAGAIRNRQR